MGVIKEQNKWEESVYLIEENDPVHGGEEGVSNKAAKQLANRTLYLRQLLIAAGQNLKPKKLTATTKNAVGTDGHTHEIDLASLTTKGLVQLTNDTGLDSEALALTAKAGKALAQAIAKAQQTAAGKWTAVDATTARKGIVQLNSATNSNAENQAATPKAVKAAFDRASTAINNAQAAQTVANNAQATANSKQSPATTLAGYGITDFIHKNLTSENLNDIKQTGIYGQARDANATTARNYPEQIAGALLVHPSAYGFMQEYVTYRGYRRYIRNQNASGDWAAWQRIDFQLNNTLTSTSTTQALTAAQGKVLKESIDTKAPIHNPSHTGTILGNYRLVIDRNETGYSPYIHIKDSSVDFSKTVSSAKTVSDIHALVKNGTNDRVLSTLRTIIQTDKNATGHYGVVGADGTTRWAWSAFGKTGNVAIGKTADDGTHKLQVAGSIHATGQTILNSPTALVRFQNNGTNYGYVGFPSSGSKNIRLCSNLWGNSYVELQESKIVAGQALYEGENRVQHHGQRYAEVTKAEDATYAGLSANMNGSWYARFEAVAGKRWKFIYSGDSAYYLPRNNSGKDKTIATVENNCTPNLVTLFKGEFHSTSSVRDVTTGRVSNGVITLAQSFKNFKYIVCVTSNDEKTAYLQQVLMTSLIPVGNTANSNWGLSGSTLYWTGRFTSNTTIQCIAENCVLHAIYGTNAI